jgi:hypothetical protein
MRQMKLIFLRKKVTNLVCITSLNAPLNEVEKGERLA